ncbi:MAG: vWA domain-containing protein [Patescibacteria group bacterium]
MFKSQPDGSQPLKNSKLPFIFLVILSLLFIGGFVFGSYKYFIHAGLAFQYDDNCPTVWNPDQTDSDDDDVGDLCDNCRDVKNGKTSGDQSRCSGGDCCAFTGAEESKCDQANADGDSRGDACENDTGPSTCDNAIREGSEECDCSETKQIVLGQELTPNVCSSTDYGDGSRSICADGDLTFSSNSPDGDYYLILTSSNYNDTTEEYGIRHQIDVKVNDATVGHISALASAPARPQKNAVNLGTVPSGAAITLTWTNDVYCAPGQEVNCPSAYPDDVNSDLRVYSVALAVKSADPRCRSVNGTAPIFYSPNRQNAYYCSDSCRTVIGVSEFCGDGERQGATHIPQGNEICDDNYYFNAANAGPANGCANDCQKSCPDHGATYTLQDITISPRTRIADDINNGRNTSEIFFEDCRVANKISGQICVKGSVEETAIVFVTDLSASMGDRLSELKTALKTSMEKLFEAPRVSIGLVSFSDSANDDTEDIQDCDLSLCKNDKNQLNAMSEKVNGYRTGGRTRTDLGIQKAREILNNSSVPKKIIILMSDDSPEKLNQSGIIGDINNYTESAKSSGIEIYVAGFTNDKNILGAFNYWSSNNGQGNIPDVAPTEVEDCDFWVWGFCSWNAHWQLAADIYNTHGCSGTFCFTDLNLEGLYEGIINKINSELNMKVSISIDGGPEIYFPDVGPDPNNENVYKCTNKEISLPIGFCHSIHLPATKHTITLDFDTTQPGNAVDLRNWKLSYCPKLGLDIPHEADCTDNDGDTYNIEGGICDSIDCCDNTTCNTHPENIYPGAAEAACSTDHTDYNCDGVNPPTCPPETAPAYCGDNRCNVSCGQSSCQVSDLKTQETTATCPRDCCLTATSCDGDNCTNNPHDPVYSPACSDCNSPTGWQNPTCDATLFPGEYCQDVHGIPPDYTVGGYVLYRPSPSSDAIPPGDLSCRLNINSETGVKIYTCYDTCVSGETPPITLKRWGCIGANPDSYASAGTRSCTAAPLDDSYTCHGVANDETADYCKSTAVTCINNCGDGCESGCEATDLDCNTVPNNNNCCNRAAGENIDNEAACPVKVGDMIKLRNGTNWLGYHNDYIFADNITVKIFIINAGSSSACSTYSLGTPAAGDVNNEACVSFLGVGFHLSWLQNGSFPEEDSTYQIINPLDSPLKIGDVIYFKVRDSYGYWSARYNSQSKIGLSTNQQAWEQFQVCRTTGTNPCSSTLTKAPSASQLAIGGIPSGQVAGAEEASQPVSQNIFRRWWLFILNLFKI